MGKWFTPENIRKVEQAAEDFKRQANSLTDEDIERYIAEDPEAAEFLEFAENGVDVDAVAFNYADMPNNSKSTNDEVPPWEFNFAAAKQQQQQPSGLYTNNPMMPNMMMNNNSFIDKRVQVFSQHKGMKFYNINPYMFINEEYLLEYYESLEEQRKKKCDEQVFWAHFYGKYQDPQIEEMWVKNAEFKPADQIVEEYENALMEQQKLQTEIISNRSDYDENGYRKGKTVYLVNTKTGETITCKGKKTHRTEDEKKAREYKRIIEGHQMYKRMLLEAGEKERQRYLRHKKTYAEGRSNDVPEGITSWNIQNENFNARRNAQIINRALEIKTYSKQRYNQILKNCCNTDLIYSNRSDFFSLSYDFDRDIHYRKLLANSIEELDQDEKMKNKIKEEYEIRKRMFMNKVSSGDLWVDTTPDINYQPTLPKPNVESLTLEDYKKPENNVNYTALTNADIVTENIFMPDEVDVDMAAFAEALRQARPPQSLGREVGYGTISDDGTVTHHKIDYDGNKTDEVFNIQGMDADQILATYF